MAYAATVITGCSAGGSLPPQGSTTRQTTAASEQGPRTILNYVENQRLTDGYRIRTGSADHYLPANSVFYDEQSGGRDLLIVSGRNYSAIVQKSGIKQIAKITQGAEQNVASGDLPMAPVPELKCLPGTCGSTFNTPCDGYDWCAECFPATGCNGYSDYPDPDVSWCIAKYCGQSPSNPTVVGGNELVIFADPQAACTYDFSSQYLSCFASQNNWHDSAFSRDVSGAYFYNTRGQQQLSCGSTGARQLVFGGGRTPDPSFVWYAAEMNFDNSRGSTWYMATPYATGTAITLFFYGVGIPPSNVGYCHGAD